MDWGRKSSYWDKVADFLKLGNRVITLLDTRIRTVAIKFNRLVYEMLFFKLFSVFHQLKAPNLGLFFYQ